MERAHKFLDKIEHQLLRLMEKEIHELHPKELDLIIGLCEMHAGICEFIELEEKFDSKHDGLFDNPRRRR